MTLLISTMGTDAKIAVDSTYRDLSLLKKNLVINNLEVEMLDPTRLNTA